MSFEIVTEIMQELCKTKQLDNSDKGQLISEWNLPKMQPEFWQIFALAS